MNLDRGTLIAVVLLLGPSALARPEYATKVAQSCVACHANVWGGGPKTVYGKIYGSRGLGIAKTSSQDLFSASLRGIAYFPEKISKNSNGFAVMEAAASGNAAVIEGSDTTNEVRMVGTYNMAPLGPGVREAYSRITFTRGDRSPIYLTVGRFSSPFGLMTDEHRTYTRILTNSTLNTYDAGVAVSGNLVTGLTYDFALVNDLPGTGGFNTMGNVYGWIGNLRWLPSFAPIMLGVSQNFNRVEGSLPAFATSAYGVLSVDRLTRGAVPIALLSEVVIARSMEGAAQNPSFGPFFIPSTDTAYQTSLSTSQALGEYSLLRFDLTNVWMFFYKFDYLIPDRGYSADSFTRHGLGVELTLNSNAYLNVRAERAFVGRPEIVNTTAFVDQDDLLAMLRFWL